MSVHDPGEGSGITDWTSQENFYEKKIKKGIDKGKKM